MLFRRSVRRILTDYKRHPWLHASSISTITISLVILGLYFLCYRNFVLLAEKTAPQVNGTVYLKEGLTAEDLQSVTARIVSLESVQKVTHKTSTAVTNELKIFLGMNETENIPGADVFPDILEIEIKPNTSSETLSLISALVSKMPEVSDVDFSADWLGHYHRLRKVLHVFGIILVLGILIGCAFLVANFMGLRHQSRKDEFDIIRLVGASRNFIIAPFVWEGVLEGGVAAGLAIVVLYTLKLLISAAISIQWHSLLGVREWVFLSPMHFVWIVGCGLAMAFCGSVAIFLRFREKPA